MKVFVIDASVAVKWYIPEPFSEQAVYYLELLKAGQAKLLAPELIVAEMGNVLWKKELSGELARGEVQLIGETLASSFPAELTGNQLLLPAALELALDLKLSLYDCLYLALAIVKKAQLVTADKKLARLAGAVLQGDVVTIG
jgi:predicted nucleic acid-binding protein